MSTQYEMIYRKEDDDRRGKEKITKRRKNNDDQLFCIKKYSDKKCQKR